MTPQQLQQHSISAQNRGALSRGLLAVAIGLLSWSANNVDILRAQIQPPSGTRPSWTPRHSSDIAQHLTWVNGMRNALVIPDYHMPAITKPGLFSPLMALLGQFTKFGIGASAIYASATLLVTILGVYCILVCLRLFLTSRSQAVTAVVLLLASAPLKSSLYMWRALHGEQGGQLIFGGGDVLFVGTALTNALGTASVYASLILVTRYVLLARRRYLYATAVVAVASGLCHPFEVFTIVAATTLTFVVLRWPGLRGALMESLVVIVPGLLSVLPYIYFSITVPWMRQVTAQNTFGIPDLLHLIGMLGIPSAFVFVNLLIGPRLQAISDVVLQCWFVATLMVMHIPRLPFALHAANGFRFVTALLAVRQISQIAYLRSWVVLHPRLTAIAAAAVVAPAVFVHIGMRYKMFEDFRMSAVTSQAEYDLIRWFHRNTSDRDLVIAPTNETSWMVATAPVHTIASHWLFSGTYEGQVKLRDSFYHGDWSDETARAFLRTYGINYVVVPQGSPVQRILSAYPKAVVYPPLTLYHLPENHMSDRLPDPQLAFNPPCPKTP